MPLSKERNRERMRLQMRVKRAMLQPKSIVLQPNRYLLAHMRAYPEGFNVDGTYRDDYDPKLDPYINPLLRPSEPLPNSPDGRFHV